MSDNSFIIWTNLDILPSKSFICWYCNKDISSQKGYMSSDKNSIYICHNCKRPNIFDLNGDAIIKPLYGKEIKNLPDNIKSVYEEARKCMQVGAYTGATMLLRKILMNISVEEGAEEGGSFKSYVEYLYNNGIVHKKQKDLIDKVKNIGNKANHEIEPISEVNAEYIFKLVEHLLLNNYEFVNQQLENGND